MKLPDSKLVKRQTKKYTNLNVSIDGQLCDVFLTIRYDDRCGNGHNSFSMCANVYEAGKPRTDRYMISCGQSTEAMKAAFPNLWSLYKWHLCSSDGPMHYVANTIYHARDIDHNGLRAGEFNSFVYKVMVGEKCLYTSRIFYSFRDWLHRDEAKVEAEVFLTYINPSLSPKIIQVGSGTPSEGKHSDLEAARSSAIWPDATLEQLQDEAALMERLPALMNEFKADIESLGFTY